MFGTMKAACHVVGHLCLVAASHAYEVPSLRGEVQYASISERSLPPCGEDGVMTLEGGVLYRTEEVQKLTSTCHTIRGQGPENATVLGPGITFTAPNATLGGVLQFRGSQVGCLRAHHLAISDGHVAFDDCRSNGNHSGGAIYLEGNLSVAGASVLEITNSFALLNGGGLYTAGGVTASGNATMIFQNNTCYHGGGFYALGVTASGNATMIFQNNTGYHGGGFYAEGVTASGNATMTFQNNTGNLSGGGFYAEGVNASGNATMIFQNNTGNLSGGGFYAEGGVNASGNATMIFQKNTADLGGGFYAEGNVRIASRGRFRGDGERKSILATKGAKVSGDLDTPISTFVARNPDAKIEVEVREQSCPPGTIPAATFTRDDDWGPFDVNFNTCRACPAGTLGSMQPRKVPQKTEHPSSVAHCEMCETLGADVGGPLLECFGGASLAVPEGIMGTSHKAPEGSMAIVTSDIILPTLYRCPNPFACPGERILDVTMTGRVIGVEKMCATGYKHNDPGCRRCEGHYGRSSADPLICSKCPDRQLWLSSVLRVLLPPLVLLWCSFHQASKSDQQAASKDREGAVLIKMALSFFTSAQLAIGALPVSSRFREAEGSIPGLSSFGSLLERAVEDSPLSTQSVDCILGREVRLKDQVQWQLIVPALGVVSVFFFAVAGACCAQDAPPLRHRILRFALVWSNQFAPVLAAASASCLPCVSIAEGKAYAAFDPDIQCPNALPTLSMLKWAGMLGGVSLLMPLWWIWLARSEWESPESKEFVMAFITAGYRKDYAWWEAVVLLRKMLLTFLAAKIPVSFAPSRYIACLEGVVLVALGVHSHADPFETDASHSRDLNKLESMLLTVAMVCFISAGYILGLWWQEPLWPTLAALAVLAIMILPIAAFFALNLVPLFAKKALGMVCPTHEAGAVGTAAQDQVGYQTVQADEAM